MLPTLGLLLPLLDSPLPFFHTPHDTVRGVAVARIGSEIEIVITGNDVGRFLYTRDQGRSWNAIGGGGLDFHAPMRAAWWPHSSGGVFLLAGLGAGVWTTQPGSGQAVEANQGLPPDDRAVVHLAAPDGGSGPAFLVTGRGTVYACPAPGSPWQAVLTTGVNDPNAQVAVPGDFDPAAPVGPARQVLASIGGKLYLSDDGGSTWSVHSQFSTPATSATDDKITAIQHARDFSVSGIVVLGRGRQDPAAASGQHGEFWRSTDFGATWSKVLDVDWPVRGLAAGLGPNGRQDFFAALEQYPDPHVAPTAPGILLSTDGGATWSDSGNHQDFILEEEVHNQSHPDYLALAVSPDYTTDGTVFFGREEGFFLSRDRGLDWRQGSVRVELNTRNLAVTLGPSGERLAFGAADGSGTLLADLDTGTTQTLAGVRNHYQRDVAISPHYVADGAVMIAGISGANYWFDTSRPPSNLLGASGFLMGPGFIGSPKSVAFSPAYDASTIGPGTDLAVFMGGKGANYRSLDGGLTLEPIDHDVNGAVVPEFLRMVVAPTYRTWPLSARTDVYGAGWDKLYRLDDAVWVPLASFQGETIDALVLDPTWSRPGNPRLFAAIDSPPYLYEIYDHPTGVVVNPLYFPGLDGAIRGLSLGDDFALRPVIYAITWGAGPKKLDLSAPVPVWESVGGAWPHVWAEAIRCSPTFSSDRMLIAGTERGIAFSYDLPGSSWTILPFDSVLSSRHANLTFFAPNDPANPQPSRPWPWSTATWDALARRGLTDVDNFFRYATTDQSRLEWEGNASAVELWTFSGPNIGSVELVAFDLATGLELARTSTSLHAAVYADTRVPLALPGPGAIRLEVTATLGPGEIFPFSALKVSP